MHVHVLISHKASCEDCVKAKHAKGPKIQVQKEDKTEGIKNQETRWRQ